jgi:hypothetical protein
LINFQRLILSLLGTLRLYTTTRHCDSSIHRSVKILQHHAVWKLEHTAPGGKSLTPRGVETCRLDVASRLADSTWREDLQTRHGVETCKLNVAWRLADSTWRGDLQTRRGVETCRLNVAWRLADSTWRGDLQAQHGVET